MKETAVQKANKIFLELNPEEFYAWFWNNRDILLKMEKEQMIYIIETYHNNLFYLPLSENGEADRILDLILTKQIKPKL